jgi:endonuclease/exonuclease/phosphatase family metal-dependent hydrolase
MYSPLFAAALMLTPAATLSPTPIGFSTPAPASQAAAQTAATPPSNLEISVLTYNVHGLPWPLTKNRRAMMRAIGRELALMRQEGRQPDIVLIQEGFGGDMADLVKLSGYQHWARGPGRHDRIWGDPPAEAKGFHPARYLPFGEGWGKFTSAGLHVLSDLPITEVKSIAYRYCAGFDCLANKGAMRVRVSLPDGAGEIDVVNTHMNSKGAAKVPFSRSAKAHNLQTDELNAFVAGRGDQAPLLVGGDFNVRGSPDRYYHRVAERPFTVVSEFCNTPASDCAGEIPAPDAQPWLASEDLQAFANRGPLQVQPVKIGALFSSPETGGRLSDHDGYLVRYRLSRTGPEARPVQTASAAP